MNFDTQSKNSHSAFSLFEMLMFLSIVGILVTMAIPLFGNTEPANRSKDQRNAQSFCFLASAAQAAGANITSGTTDVEVVLRRLIDGVTVTSGPLSGRTFKFPDATDEVVTYASEFLKLHNGSLIYSPVKH